MMINRQDVLEKYNNHCAYCGKEIDLKSMQVDHKQPRRHKRNVSSAAARYVVVVGSR